MDYSEDWTKAEWDIALTAVLNHRTRLEAVSTMPAGLVDAMNANELRHVVKESYLTQVVPVAAGWIGCVNEVS